MLARAARFVGSTGERLRLRKTFRKFREFTMISEDTYTGNLMLAKAVRDVPGAIVECGAWRGGMIAGMADILGSQRRYFLFDSFEGLPPAKEIDGGAAVAWQTDKASPIYHDNCRASEHEATKAMSMSAANEYTIVKGWFRDTLATADVGPIAILRMDADWYDSTKQILDNLAGSVVHGGLIIADDYYAWEGCTRAVNEYAAQRNIRLRQYPQGGVCYIVA